MSFRDVVKITPKVQPPQEQKPIIRQPQTPPTARRENAGGASIVGDAAIRQDALKFRLLGTAAPPSGDNAAAERRADDLISQRGGAGNVSDGEARGIGKDIAEIAETDPALAIAVMNKVQAKLDNTDKGDNVADGFIAFSTDADLNRVVGTRDGRAMLESIKSRLLGGSVHSGEVGDARRIDKALTSNPIVPPETFTTDEGVPAADAYLTAPGTEVAELTAESIRDNPDTFRAKDDYLRAIERHRDDPEWLNRFYKTLGTDKTAELIQETVLSLPPAGERERNLIGQSLQTLASGGYLTQADADALLRKVAVTEDGYLHRGATLFLTEAISKVSNDAAGVQLKNLFAESAAKIAAGTLPITVRRDEAEDAKDFLAAMATHALASTPESNQATKLAALQRTLGDAGFTNLINRAMKFEKELFVPDGEGFRENFDGVGTLMKSIGSSPSAPQSLRVRMFEIASNALIDANGDIAEKYRDNLEFKEGLGNIFLKDQNRIINRSVGANGYDLTSTGLRSLNGFFREVLFTSPLAGNAADVAKSFTENMNSVLADADRLTDREFETKYGRNKREMSSLVGEQVGVLINSIEESLRNIKGKSEAEAEQIVGVLGAIISAGENIAGVGGPAATVGASIIGEALQLGLGPLGDSIAQGKYDDAVRQLRDGGVDINDFNDYTVNDILATITNPVAHDSFRDAFDYVKEILRP